MKRQQKNLVFGIAILLVGAFGVGCVGSISTTKSGQTKVELCPPALTTGSGGQSVRIQCAKAQQAKKKKQKAKHKQPVLTGTGDMLQGLLPQ